MINKTKIQRGSQCLVIKGDKIIEGTIIDALKDSVKVEYLYFKFGPIVWKKNQWFPISGKEIRVEFKSIE